MLKDLQQVAILKKVFGVQLILWGFILTKSANIRYSTWYSTQYSTRYSTRGQVTWPRCLKFSPQNCNIMRNSEHKHSFIIYYSALTRLRSRTLSIRLNDQSWVRTPLRRDLLFRSPLYFVSHLQSGFRDRTLFRSTSQSDSPCKRIPKILNPANLCQMKKCLSLKRWLETSNDYIAGNGSL